MRSFVAPASSRARTAAFLLTAVLLLALSLGVGRAAADDPNMNGGDGRVVAQAFDAGGNLYMVSQTPAHGLAVTVNYASNNSWNGPLINYVPTNNVYSTPAMLFDTDGSLFIAYQGPGHTLMVMSRWATDGQWHGPNQIENVNSVYSTPSIVKAPWGDIFVTYQGPGNSLATSVRQSSDGTWHKYPILGSSTTYSSPAQSFATYADGAHLLISAVGIDRRLVVTDRYVDGTWHGPYDQSGAGAAFSAPNMVTGKDGTLRIGFEGPGHSYGEITKTMTAWGAPVTRAGGTVYSAPSQLVDSGGNIFAAWQGPGHSLYEVVRYAIDGSWNGPNNLVNTPDITYWAPTQIYNKTTGRITISMQGTNNKLVTLINGTAWTKLDTQISNNVSTGDKYWPTSAQYGGEDGHVNTSAEADAVAAAYQGAASHTAARQLLADLDPADLPLVEFSLRNSIHDGDLVANLDNSKIYLFADFRLHYLDFSIGHDILLADAAMNAAKRMTAGSLSTITEGDAVGPYKTSWDYGGPNRLVDTDAEMDAVVGLLSTLSTADGDAVWRGLTPGDQASLTEREGLGEANADWSVDIADPDFRAVTKAMLDAQLSPPKIGTPETCDGAYLATVGHTAQPCVGAACDMMRALGMPWACDGNDKPINPQWWKDRVTKNVAGVEKTRARDALRSSLGAAPADSTGDRKGWAAHHIVAAYHPRAIWTRIIMTKCEIHPNSTDNGIYLRAPYRYDGTGFARLSWLQQQVAKHRSPWVHTKEYYEAVNTRMLKWVRGTGCDATNARAELNRIQGMLQRGEEVPMP
jgi:hypothetical protein